jgi:hypothetical protein
VRVAAGWTGCLGQLGTVAEPDATIRGSRPGWQEHVRIDTSGTVSYWVEMDIERWVPGVVEGGEFPEDALESAGQGHGRDA